MISKLKNSACLAISLVFGSLHQDKLRNIMSSIHQFTCLMKLEFHLPTLVCFGYGPLLHVLTCEQLQEYWRAL